MYPNMQQASGNPAISRNLTDSDLSSHLGPVAGSGGLHVQFFYSKVRIASTNPALNGKWSTRLCVAKIPRGDRLTIACRYISEDEAMRQFPREFAMFKQYDAVPTSGTPLHDLPGISQSQIAYLTIHNLRSIEDLLSMQPEQINGMGMEVVQAYAVAKRWMATKTDAGAMLSAAQTDATMSVENQAMREKLAAIERRNAELEAQVSVLNRLAPQQGAAQPAAMLTGDVAPYQVQAARDPDPVDDLPDPMTRESNLFSGGMVDGNDDLIDSPTPENPLGLKPRAKRG